MFLRSIKEINRLLSKQNLKTYQKFDFPSYFQPSDHADIIAFYVAT